MIDPEIIRLVEKYCTIKNFLMVMFILTLIFVFCAILTEGSGMFLGYSLKHWSAAFGFTTTVSSLVYALYWGMRHDMGLEGKDGR